MPEQTMTKTEFDATLRAQIRAGLEPALEHLADLAVIVGRLVAEVNALRARVAKLEGRTMPEGTWPAA